MGRRLGQHFLHDPAILDRIVDALLPSPEDIVVEIGMGKGTLTRRIAMKAGRVVSIEKDVALLSALQSDEAEGQLPPNVTGVQGDALDLDWHALAGEVGGIDDSSSGLAFKIVGNIPYYITAPLIEKALEPPMPQVAVYLVQREVADRLAADPGTKAYGALTVGVNVVATVEQLFVVKAGSFAPPPAVDSAVVRLTPREQGLIAEEERLPFRRFTAGLFGQRRKQLSRALRTVTDSDKDVVDATLGSLDLDTTVRPEALTPGELVGLFHAMQLK